jgi:SAM-dependent methyltransferase
MSIHPAASTGFSRAAAAYERGRPEYPAEAVDWLVRELDIGPGRTVIDLAAGTGKLTRALLPTEATVVAVEPIAEMRALIEGVETFDGRADTMPFPERWADAVTVGQAFHWFATDEAVAEIARVLKPGGGLALIWNSRDETDRLQAAIGRLLVPHAGDVARHYGPQWRDPLDRSPDFGPIVSNDFEQRQEVDEDGLVDRFCSVSFIAALEQEPRAEIEARLRALARERGGRVTLPYVTEVFVTRRR